MCSKAPEHGRVCSDTSKPNQPRHWILLCCDSDQFALTYIYSNIPKHWVLDDSRKYIHLPVVKMK